MALAADCSQNLRYRVGRFFAVAVAEAAGLAAAAAAVVTIAAALFDRPYIWPENCTAC